MKLKVVPLLLVILLLAGCAETTGGENDATYRQITMSEAVEMMASESDYIILDVRRPDEFSAGIFLMLSIFRMKASVQMKSTSFLTRTGLFSCIAGAVTAVSKHPKSLSGSDIQTLLNLAVFSIGKAK